MEPQIGAIKYLATTFYNAVIIGDMRIFDTEKEARDYIVSLEASSAVKGATVYRLWKVSNSTSPVFIKI